MKYLLTALIAFLLCTPIALGELTNAELNYTDVPRVIQAPDADLEAEIYCDLVVVVVSRGSFTALRNAKDFCKGYSPFCIVRTYSKNFYESDFRHRVIFRGRGDNYNSGRQQAWNLYNNFIGKRGYYKSQFNHSFHFTQCRG
jgi:hypothetical protein